MSSESSSKQGENDAEDEGVSSLSESFVPQTKRSDSATKQVRQKVEKLPSQQGQETKR